MPLGIERINARHKSPNERINFIKPLEGPDKALSQDFLERVAAICSPIMKANHLAVMSLEEYEPNLEFVGRNFNNGEVIQLVLKAPFTGQWLPFRHVQMVMMHELAHIKHMNHSGAFWKVRNQYAGELRALWAKRYTGDGLWSRGQTLLSGRYTTQDMPNAEAMPKSLCGGTYRSSNKRKRTSQKGAAVTPKISYAERQQRKIAKKFGTNGVTLGGDEEGRVKWEEGKKAKGKPRVAQSARGRELRAAAALARFGQQQKDTDVGKTEPVTGSGSDTEQDDVDTVGEMALDIDGKPIRDGQGRRMVKVCEDEDGSNEEVMREMEELRVVDEDAASVAGSAPIEVQ
ncbi:MAG: hypothetical protein M1816_007781 [Peltula sp. TS41687]|nr:MAG: hypothetical protein M1816_007781 [Peltula sp. TS41687]